MAAAKVEGVSEIQEFRLGLDVLFREVSMHTMIIILILFNKCFFWLQVMILAQNFRIPEGQIVTAFNWPLVSLNNINNFFSMRECT